MHNYNQTNNGNGNRPTERVLVCGATGYLGRHVIQTLSKRGYFVRALVRDEGRLGNARPLCNEIFTGEATKPDTLKELCRDMNVVFSSLGVRSFDRSPSVHEVDYRANMNILEQALKSNVRQFIFISICDGELMRDNVPAADARERFVEELMLSPIAWSVLRPTGFFNDMFEYFEMARNGRMFLFDDGSARINPIHGRDLAEKVLQCITNDEYRNQVRTAGGPRIYSYREIAELAFKALDRAESIISLPSWLTAPLSYFVKPFNENVAGFLEFLRYIATHDVIGEPCGAHDLETFFQELASHDENDYDTILQQA